MTCKTVSGSVSPLLFLFSPFLSWLSPSASSFFMRVYLDLFSVECDTTRRGLGDQHLVLFCILLALLSSRYILLFRLVLSSSGRRTTTEETSSAVDALSTDVSLNQKCVKIKTAYCSLRGVWRDMERYCTKVWDVQHSALSCIPSAHA